MGMVNIDASIGVKDMENYIYRCKGRTQRVKGSASQKDTIKGSKWLKTDLSRWQR